MSSKHVVCRNGRHYHTKRMSMTYQVLGQVFLIIRSHVDSKTVSLKFLCCRIGFWTTVAVPDQVGCTRH